MKKHEESKMKRFVEFMLYYVSRMAFAFRYRIKVKGLDNLNSTTLPKKGGVLFLPNHPSVFVDPTIVTMVAWKKYPIRPMVVEYMYYTPIIGWVLRVLDALPIPDFATSSNSLKRKRSESVIQQVITSLREGQNFLVYPAGRTKSTGLENIGGASAVNRIIHEVPEVNVVLVRIKGLWGSSFSRAFLGKAPPIFPTLGFGVKHVLKNLLFFTPRREVIVEFYPAPPDFPYTASRLEMNRWLENWYNKPDGLTQQKGELPGDSFITVSYSMWGDVFPQIQKRQELDNQFDLTKIPNATKEKVLKKLGEMAALDPANITPEMDIASDLGLDSLDTAEMIGYMQDQFDIDNMPVNEMTSVGRILAIADKQIVMQEKVDDTKINLKKWFKKIPHRRATVPSGETIPEVYLKQCKIQGNSPACGDDRMGVVTYSQMKLRVILLAEYIRTLPGPYVGILLPASTMANVLVAATQLAGKIPLMVNWTVGPRHLESVIKLSNVKIVLSSWAFLDKVENIDLDGMEDRLVMLEDLRRRFGWKEKLKALWQSKMSTQSILKHFNIDKKTRDDIAVLLFTSGTEGMPKGVPLTHENIMSNQRGILEATDLYRDDVIHGILPPFHSFGFTISCLLATVIGARVAYFPNPTDGKGLAKSLEKWGVTVCAGAPTFIKGMLRSAKPEQIKTLRLVATGAEKTPPDLFRTLEEMGKPNIISEGYGITECSPVLTFNRPGRPCVGVGRAAIKVELMIVHPDTNEPLPLGDRGLILASGPGIFSGYINPGLSSPFLYIKGVRWFKTGDLGFLDEEGNLTISGRLKRFVKVGGEMISLAAIEEALFEYAVSHKLPTSPDGPSLAVSAKEIDGEKPKFYVFSVFKISADEANTALKKAGFTNLVKIAQVHQLEELPALGSGKINYRALENDYLGEKK